MKTGIMSFSEVVKTDKKLRARIVAVNSDLQKNGLPRTAEGMREMYAVYNLIYGKSKKPTNCIYCRIAVKGYIEKAVLLLEIKEKKATPEPKPEPKATAPAEPKAPTKTKPATKPKGKGPSKPKKRK